MDTDTTILSMLIIPSSEIFDLISQEITPKYIKTRLYHRKSL